MSLFNCFSFLTETASKKDNHPAVIDAFGEFTYLELLTESIALAEQLTDRGIGPDSVVAIISENSRNFFVALFAVFKVGAIALPFPPNRHERDYSLGFNEFGVRAVIRYADTPYTATPDSEIPHQAPHLHIEVLRSSPPAIPFASAAVIRPTSGTTAKSKGVVLTHSAVEERTAAAISALNLTSNDRVCWVLPMAQHFIATILAYVRCGATTVVADSHLAESLLSTIYRHHCTVLYAAPLQISLLAESQSKGDRSADQRLQSLRLAISTSAPLSVETAQQFASRFGIEITPVFGIIELGLPLARTQNGPGGVESVGRPTPGFTVKINDHLIDSTSHSITTSANSPGELYIKGPGMFSGYLNPPLPAERVLVDGFFPTGDLATITESGAIRICGRSKAVIISAGQKVFAEEVEQTLNSYPGVTISRVFGLPHHLLGEQVAAEVEVQDPLLFREAAAIKFCREKLPGFMVPQKIVVADRIARTETGKIIRIDQKIGQRIGQRV